MASRTALLITAALAVAAVVGAVVPAATALHRQLAVFKVGDDSGWNVGVDYAAWASSKDIQEYDSIEFVYPKGSHNVVVVDEGNYTACTVPNGAFTMSSGQDYDSFNGNPGPAFYICGFPGHCQSGMKLAVNVRAVN